MAGVSISVATPAFGIPRNATSTSCSARAFLASGWPRTRRVSGLDRSTRPSVRMDLPAEYWASRSTTIEIARRLKLVHARSPCWLNSSRAGDDERSRHHNSGKVINRAPDLGRKRPSPSPIGATLVSDFLEQDREFLHAGIFLRIHRRNRGR